MSTEKLAKEIESLLPDRGTNVNYELGLDNHASAKEAAAKLVQKYTAKELAQIKAREKYRLNLEKMKAERLKAKEAAGIAPGRTAHQQRILEEQEATVAAVEALEEQSKSLVPDLIKANVGKSLTPAQASVLQTTTPREVTKLLTSLNVNLNLQLTKSDTSNLLACLLTCNETQLTALYNNKKIPVAIKTVIKRLLEDVRQGNLHTVNMLWDRVFGKNALSQPDPAQQAQGQANGLIPGTPISREAYIILRDTLIK